MAKAFVASTKKIFDPIHGFIRFDEIERKLIDSFPFQRLHYIRQLGITFLVYPGATHTRFEHSLGVMDLASRIYKSLCQNVRPDIFPLIPRKGSLNYQYWQKILRLAGLCHDLGHLPFSHVAEKTLLLKDHEAWTLEIIKSALLDPVFNKLQEKSYFNDKNIKEDVIKIAIGEKKLKKLGYKCEFSSWEKILSEIITADFFGADRIDYLIRDSKSTGIVSGTFDYPQLIEMLRILPSLQNEGDFELGIDENGLEACEALMLSRHFMHKRVYQYSSVKSFNFHLKRFMQILFQELKIVNVSDFLNLSDFNIIFFLHEAAQNSKKTGHEDAKRIVFRTNHFKALAVDNSISEQELIDFKKKHGLGSEIFDFEILPRAASKHSISFPVARKNLNLIEAGQLSPILANIPTTRQNWVFIHPEYQSLFFEAFMKK